MYQGKSTTPPARRFLGKTENFDSKEEQKFEKRHLHAYLSGNPTFNYHGATYVVKSEILVKKLVKSENQ